MGEDRSGNEGSSTILVVVVVVILAQTFHITHKYFLLKFTARVSDQKREIPGQTSALTGAYLLRTGLTN